LTIIYGMKGRIGYAMFWNEPGIEKLHNFYVDKSSFLKPVTSRPYQRVPFLTRTVAELAVWTFLKFPCIATAAVFFSACGFIAGGLQSFQRFSLSTVVLAVRLFFVQAFT